MRHAGGELAHRGHLLGLEELPLRFFDDADLLFHALLELLREVAVARLGGFERRMLVGQRAVAVLRGVQVQLGGHAVACGGGNQDLQQRRGGGELAGRARGAQSADRFQLIEERHGRQRAARRRAGDQRHAALVFEHEFRPEQRLQCMRQALAVDRLDEAAERVGAVEVEAGGQVLRGVHAVQASETKRSAVTPCSLSSAYCSSARTYSRCSSAS